MRRTTSETLRRVVKVGIDVSPLALSRAGREDGVDVLHCPTQRAPVHAGLPLVVTIHDVAVLRHPKAFNLWTRRYSALTLPRIARAATRIIVGSAFTRDEVTDLLQVSEAK